MNPETIETIAAMLSDNVETLKRNVLDMSMFPKEEVPRIYAAAAESALSNRDFDATGRYLYLGKQWARLLELGIPFFYSEDAEEQKVGKLFLETFMHHDKLPEATAIELADHILRHEKYFSHMAATALRSGNAIQKAEQIAHEFFENGNFKDGKHFFEITGKKLTAEEVTRFAGIALKFLRYEDALELYKSQKLILPKDRANTIANSSLGEWIFDRVVEYMDETKNSFTAEEFKDFADAIFNTSKYEKALKLYERAGKIVSSDEYKAKGEQILEQVRDIESSRSFYSSGVMWPTISSAFAYLSKSNINEAKQRIVQFADSLLEQADFAKISSNAEFFVEIYKMIEMQMPVNGALKAARLLEEKKLYGLAAKSYAAAGMNDDAKRMGYMALKIDDAWQRNYQAEAAFKAAGDEDGLAVVKFMRENLT